MATLKQKKSLVGADFLDDKHKYIVCIENPSIRLEPLPLGQRLCLDKVILRLMIDDFEAVCPESSLQLPPNSNPNQIPAQGIQIFWDTAMIFEEVKKNPVCMMVSVENVQGQVTAKTTINLETFQKFLWLDSHYIKGMLRLPIKCEPAIRKSSVLPKDAGQNKTRKSFIKANRCVSQNIIRTSGLGSPSNTNSIGNLGVSYLQTHSSSSWSNHRFVGDSMPESVSVIIPNNQQINNSSKAAPAPQNSLIIANKCVHPAQGQGNLACVDKQNRRESIAFGLKNGQSLNNFPDEQQHIVSLVCNQLSGSKLESSSGELCDYSRRATGSSKTLLSKPTNNKTEKYLINVIESNNLRNFETPQEQEEEEDSDTITQKQVQPQLPPQALALTALPFNLDHIQEARDFESQTDLQCEATPVFSNRNKRKVSENFDTSSEDSEQTCVLNLVHEQLGKLQFAILNECQHELAEPPPIQNKESSKYCTSVATFRGLGDLQSQQPVFSKGSPSLKQADGLSTSSRPKSTTKQSQSNPNCSSSKTFTQASVESLKLVELNAAASLASMKTVKEVKASVAVDQWTQFQLETETADTVFEAAIIRCEQECQTSLYQQDPNEQKSGQISAVKESCITTADLVPASPACIPCKPEKDKQQQMKVQLVGSTGFECKSLLNNSEGMARRLQQILHSDPETQKLKSVSAIASTNLTNRVSSQTEQGLTDKRSKLKIQSRTISYERVYVPKLEAPKINNADLKIGQPPVLKISQAQNLISEQKPTKVRSLRKCFSPPVSASRIRKYIRSIEPQQEQLKPRSPAPIPRLPAISKYQSKSKNSDSLNFCRPKLASAIQQTKSSHLKSLTQSSLQSPRQLISFKTRQVATNQDLVGLSTPSASGSPVNTPSLSSIVQEHIPLKKGISINSNLDSLHQFHSKGASTFGSPQVQKKQKIVSSKKLACNGTCNIRRHKPCVGCCHQATKTPATTSRASSREEIVLRQAPNSMHIKFIKPKYNFRPKHPNQPANNPQNSSKSHLHQFR